MTEALKDSGTITVTGTYSTIPESHGGKKYRGAAIGGTMGYSYSAQVVEVTVDEETGEVSVDKVWVAHDCGKALNRLTVEGQVQGSVWMGMGQAMSEEAGYHDGLLVTANMLDYRVPTIQDSPPIEVGIVESNDPHGPFGAKEAGEGSLAAFLPALTNAIADATGLRFNDLPVTPDRVFAAIEKRAARARARSATGAPDGSAGRIPAAAPTTLADVLEARAAHPQPAAGRRHRPHRQHAPRHRCPARADRHERRGRAAHRSGRRGGLRDRRLRDAGRAGAASPACWRTIRCVAQAAGSIAGPTHRNMGTVGGNLCLDTRCIFYNQSQWWRAANNHCLKTTGEICHVAPKSRGVCFATFSGDLAPALLTLGAEVDLVGPDGRRTLPLEKLYIGHARHDGSGEGDGKHYLALQPGEIVTAVRGQVRARPALGLRQDPHPPLDRVSGGGRGRGAAARGRHAGRSARRHHRHQPAPRAARGHAGAVRRTRSTMRVLKGLDELVRDQIMSMKTTFTPGHYRRRVAGVLARRLVVRLFGRWTNDRLDEGVGFGAGFRALRTASGSRAMTVR